MIIANPIYDVVFKYMMEDNKIAKLLISAIIDEEIETLDFRPHDRVHKIERGSGAMNVYRLDFSARIKTKEGMSKQILIEVQKAKFSADIMRFRKYLGKEYSDEENMIQEKNRKKKGYKKYGIPIISIYFLGYQLDEVTAPVIKVKRDYYDHEGKKIEKRDVFIESLTHDAFIIQIPYLKEKRKGELLTLLSIFDQSQRMESSHILNVKDEDFPEKYRKIIRRLQKAKEEPKVREVMDLEDEILEELEDLERTIAEQDQELEKKNQELVKKDQALEKKDQALEKKDLQLLESARIMKEAGILIEQIESTTKLTKEEISKL